MSHANNIGAQLCLIVGDNELESNEAELKNMETGEGIPIHLSELVLQVVLLRSTQQTHSLADLASELNSKIDSEWLRNKQIKQLSDPSLDSE